MYNNFYLWGGISFIFPSVSKSEAWKKENFYWKLYWRLVGIALGQVQGSTHFRLRSDWQFPTNRFSPVKNVFFFLSRCLKWKMIITWLCRCRGRCCCCCLISVYKSRMNCDRNQQHKQTIRWQIVEFHCSVFPLFMELQSLTKASAAGWIVNEREYPFITFFNSFQCRKNSICKLLFA